MRRRHFLRGLIMPLLIGPPVLAGCRRDAPSAPSEVRHYRIGVLEAGSVTPVRPGILQALKESGYVEGENVTFEQRAGGTSTYPALAKELADLPVDLILATSDFAARAARDATSDIPIVGLFQGDPVADGLVASFAHPGGNVTGVTRASPQLAEKQVEFLFAVAPSASRVGVLLTLGVSGTDRELAAVEAAVQSLGGRTVPLDLPDARPETRQPAFAAARAAGVQSLVVFNTAVAMESLPDILTLVGEQRLPAVYASPVFVQRGGLMSYSANIPALFVRLGFQIARILGGEPPAAVPVELPQTFDFVINLEAVRTIGLTIPPTVLSQATQVIQ